MLNMQMSGANVTSPVADALHIIHSTPANYIHSFVVYLPQLTTVHPNKAILYTSDSIAIK